MRWWEHYTWEPVWHISQNKHSWDLELKENFQKAIDSISTVMVKYITTIFSFIFNPKLQLKSLIYNNDKVTLWSISSRCQFSSILIYPANYHFPF